MPIQSTYVEANDMLVTELVGIVTDDELVSYYGGLLKNRSSSPIGGGELVDGRGVERMEITRNGQQRLSGILQPFREQLRGRKCAFLAESDVVYGMFRMWQVQKESIPYPTAIFRSHADALRWLNAPGTDLHL